MNAAGLSRENLELEGVFMEKDTTIGSSRLTALFDSGTFVETGAFLRRDDGTPAGVVCGYGAVDEMCESRELLEILQKMNRNGKFITALCAAPAVLAKAGILEGKSYTAYTGYGEKISQGTYVKKPVVTDGNLITGMGPAMAYAVAFRAVQALGGDAQAVKDRMLYDHSFQEVDQ